MTDEQIAFNVAALWSAVDRLTQPSNRRLIRDNDPTASDETVADLKLQSATGRIVPNDLARYSAMKRTHAVIPSLWDQSEDALTASTADQAEGKSGSVHRSPCDIDLMEIRSTIRETVETQLDGRKLKPRATVPLQIRQLAAHIVTHEPDHVDWWQFRFEQWARVLAVYLQAVQTQPKPRRLRGAACPECQITAVVIEDATGEKVNAPPLVIDFKDGLVRAAECSGCGATWWRGDELGELANLVNPLSDDSDTMTA